MKILNVTRSSMTGYIQLQEADRFSSTVINGDPRDKFILKYRDNWQNKPDSSDALNHRGRVEFRSETYDPVGSTVEHEHVLKLDPSYPKITPKQTVGQGFDEVNGYPYYFLRLENGELSFFRNYYENGKTPAGQAYSLPSFKFDGENHIKVTCKLIRGKAKGYVKVEVNGNVDLELINCSLLADNAGKLYRKYGLYMSSLDKWDAANPGVPVPDLIAEYWGVKSKVLDVVAPPVEVPTQPTVPADPVSPTPPVVVVPTPTTPNTNPAPVIDDQDALDVLEDAKAQVIAMQSALSKLKSTLNRLEREIKD